jgi:phage N-6-adenine-methyltransferase
MKPPQTHVLRCRGPKCGATFTSRRRDSLTCSAACRQARARLRRTGPRSAVLAAEYGLSRGDLWGTPPSLLAALRTEFDLVLDCAATEEDAVCARFIGPEDHGGGLTVSWFSRLPAVPLLVDRSSVSRRPTAVWVNPPSSARGGGHLAWFSKAAAEAAGGLTVVMLAAASPGSAAMRLARRQASEIRWFTRRLRCVHPDTGQQGAHNNTDQQLLIWTPRGGPAVIRDVDPPTEGPGRPAPADWSPRYRAAGCPQT